jgi:excisionase family DNA binding protein
MINLEVLLKKYCSGESYVSIRIIAVHFGMSIPTIYRLALSGKIPSYKIGGKRRFKISELEAAFKTESM